MYDQPLRRLVSSLMNVDSVFADTCKLSKSRGQLERQVLVTYRVAICESLFEKCPGLCRQPSPSTILRWLLAEAAPHKNGDGKYSVEDREDGATGNAERSGETQPACNGSSTWPGGSCDGPLWLTSRRCPIKATATAAV